jgi:hypothetical protein
VLWTAGRGNHAERRFGCRAGVGEPARAAATGEPGHPDGRRADGDRAEDRGAAIMVVISGLNDLTFRLTNDWVGGRTPCRGGPRTSRCSSERIPGVVTGWSSLATAPGHRYAPNGTASTHGDHKVNSGEADQS